MSLAGFVFVPYREKRMKIQEIQEELGTPPLLLKLTKDLGKLPAGIVVELPYAAAIPLPVPPICRAACW